MEQLKHQYIFATNGKYFKLNKHSNKTDTQINIYIYYIYIFLKLYN